MAQTHGYAGWSINFCVFFLCFFSNVWKNQWASVTRSKEKTRRDLTDTQIPIQNCLSEDFAITLLLLIICMTTYTFLERSFDIQWDLLKYAKEKNHEMLTKKPLKVQLRSLLKTATPRFSPYHCSCAHFNPLRANYCHTWHIENHPFWWRRIRRVRRIQVCMARKGLNENLPFFGKPCSLRMRFNHKNTGNRMKCWLKNLPKSTSFAPCGRLSHYTNVSFVISMFCQPVRVLEPS